MQHIKRATPQEIEQTVRAKFLPNFKKEVAIREVEFLKPIFDYDCEITKAQWDAGSKLWFTEATKVKSQPYERMVDNSFIKVAKANIK